MFAGDAHADSAARHRTDPAAVAGRVLRRPAPGARHAADRAPIASCRPRSEAAAAIVPVIDLDLRRRRHGQSPRREARSTRARTRARLTVRLAAGRNAARTQKPLRWTALRVEFAQVAGRPVQIQPSCAVYIRPHAARRWRSTGFDLDASQVRHPTSSVAAMAMSESDRYADIQVTTIELGNPEIQIRLRPRARRQPRPGSFATSRTGSSRTIRGEVATRYTLRDQQDRRPGAKRRQQRRIEHRRDPRTDRQPADSERPVSRWAPSRTSTSRNSAPAEIRRLDAGTRRHDLRQSQLSATSATPTAEAGER